MLALILVALAATLLYLTNQNQQILAKPISTLLGVSCALIAVVFGLLTLYQQHNWLLALLKCIAMISIVFMFLPVIGGFYANNRSNQSVLLNGDSINRLEDFKG